jgi:hypothetical protein
MAAMSTALTEFADNGDSRTFTYTGHKASDPRLVIQKRKVPTGDQVVAETSLSVVSGTEDAGNIPLAQRVSFQAVVRYPIAGTYADVTAALAVFRDIVASDEFTASVQTQNWVK